MKINENIKKTKIKLISGIKKMPITFFLGIAFMLVSIINYNMGYNDINKDLLKILNWNIFILTILSISVNLKNFLEESKKKIIIDYILLFSFIVVNIFINLKLDGYGRYINNRSLVLFSITTIFFFGRKESNNYSFYTLDILKSLFISFLYSLILFLGISSIIFTINTLFSLNINSDIYFYSFISIFSIFSLSLFIGNLPEIDKDYSKSNLKDVFKTLIKYILIPLILIYTVILYMFFIKIIISKSLPEGIITNLVLWYSIITIIVLFFEEGKLLSVFRRYQPKLQIPLLAMMLYSIYLRIDQYGFTEKRYILLLLSIWILGVFILYIKNENFDKRVLPITLSVLFLVINIGPLKSTNIAIKSQNNRLEKILKDNNMIENGKIIKSPNIPIEEKEDIIGILAYFEVRHKLSDIKYLDEKFEFDNMKNVFGFDQSDLIIAEEYVEYNIYKARESIDLEGIKEAYFIEKGKVIEGKEILIKYDDKDILEIKSKDNFSINIKEKIEEKILEVGTRGLEKEQLDFDLGDGFKIIVTSLDGYVDGEELNIYNIELIILKGDIND